MRIDQYTKKRMREFAEKFFMRLQHTNPFPAMVYAESPDEKERIHQTYLSCLPFDIAESVTHLMRDNRYAGILDTNRYTTLRLQLPKEDDSGPDRFMNVKFAFSGMRPSCSHYARKAMIDPEHSDYDGIVAWAFKAQEVNKDIQRCRKFVNQVIEWANTVGQMRTMFPDYVHLLAEGQQRHIAGMAKRSPLPKDADESYLSEHRQFVAEKTAMCLLLPENGEDIWLD